MLNSEETVSGHQQPVDDKIPLLTICGFLGAGKTTLLNTLLRNSGGRKIGVLVNDLGEVNIDADLLRDGEKDFSGGIIELTSGCICCSIETELSTAVYHLLDKFQPEVIVVEASGVAEPLSILGSLFAEDLRGNKATDRVSVINAVTVVSAVDWDRHLRRKVAPLAKKRHVVGGGFLRPYPELLVEQIECADVLLMSKIDLLEDSTGEMVDWLRALNPRAEIIRMDSDGSLVELLLQRIRFDALQTPNSAGWKKKLSTREDNDHEHDCDHHHHHHDHHHDHECGHDHSCGHPHGHKPHHQDYGIDSFVFRSRQTFSEAAFLRVMREGWPGLLRAKGFYWLADQQDRVGVVSVAGNIIRADLVGLWWHERLQRGEVTLEEIPETVQRVWEEPWGDRRQEIVFIGIDLDRQKIEADLRACFASS